MPANIEDTAARRDFDTMVDTLMQIRTEFLSQFSEHPCQGSSNVWIQNGKWAAFRELNTVRTNPIHLRLQIAHGDER